MSRAQWKRGELQMQMALKDGSGCEPPWYNEKSKLQWLSRMFIPLSQ